MVVRYGTLKVSKLLKVYIMISQTDCWFENKYADIYVTCRIGTTPNTNQYQVTKDRFLVIKCLTESNLSKGLCTIMLKEQERLFMILNGSTV